MKVTFPSTGGAPDALYEVTDIALRKDRLGALHGAQIGTPHKGWKGNAHAVHISGWVLGRDAPAHTIEILHRGKIIREVKVTGARPEIAELYPGVPGNINCMFGATVGLLGLGQKCKLSLRAVLGTDRRGPIGAVRLRRQPVCSGFEPALQPLMVTSLGRSGSTVMQQILASHHQITVYPEFPYEHKIGGYWLHALKVLSEPANRLHSSDHIFETNAWWVGTNPYNDEFNLKDPAFREWFGRDHVERQAAFCQSNIEEWYKLVASRQREGASDGRDADARVNPDAPLFFAEKFVPSALQEVAWELYPRAKEILLVRDFRDMASSILAFDKKRGYFGFGRRSGDSEESYIRMLRPMARDLADAWRERKDRARLVRYEDLVLRPHETLAGLLDYLELDASEVAVDDLVAVMRGASAGPGVDATVRMHRTSSDAAASVGRWRHDLDESLHAPCRETFSDLLEEFGYPEDGYLHEDRVGSPAGSPDPTKP
jgi:hypothetical protein